MEVDGDHPQLTTAETWWELLQQDPYYDSEEEGARPVKQDWPADSLLTKDHFTIDQQACLKCKKQLGYALPMGKEPNPHFLFCCNEDGSDKCRLQADYLNCWACGNINSHATGAVVCRPGNCAYYKDPSQIYEFMCYHCHKDMMENEPGQEECLEQMKKIRELRKTDKSAAYGLPQQMFAGSGAFFNSQLPSDSLIAKKRKRASEKDPQEEPSPCPESDRSMSDE